MSKHTWYHDVIYSLINKKCAHNLERVKKRKLRLDASKYVFVGKNSFQKYLEGILLRCVDDKFANEILKSFYGSVKQVDHVGGHFAAKETVYNIFRTKYFWRTIFKDIFKFLKSCNGCQRVVGKLQYLAMPLKPIISTCPFVKLGLYFIGQINPPSLAGHAFILTVPDYFTKWYEVVPDL